VDIVKGCDDRVRQCLLEQTGLRIWAHPLLSVHSVHSYHQIVGAWIRRWRRISWMPPGRAL